MTTTSLIRLFRNELCNRIEEQEEDLEETMQKYKSAIDNYNKSQSELVGVNTEFEALKSEKYLLEERLRNLKLSNEQYEVNYVDKSHVLRAEARAREAETKLEFEKSTTKRLETQIARLKDNKEKYENQRSQDLSEKDREKVKKSTEINEENRKILRTHRENRKNRCKKLAKIWR
jgi:myosin-18